MPSAISPAATSIRPSRSGSGRAAAFRGDVMPYWIAQVVGAIAAAAVLYLIASGKAGFELPAGFAINGYGDHLARRLFAGRRLIAKSC